MVTKPKTLTLADFNREEIAILRGIGEGERQWNRRIGGWPSARVARERIDKLGLRYTRSTPQGRKHYEKLSAAGLEVLKLIREDDARRRTLQLMADQEADRRERIERAGPKLLEAAQAALRARDLDEVAGILQPAIDEATEKEPEGV